MGPVERRGNPGSDGVRHGPHGGRPAGRPGPALRYGAVCPGPPDRAGGDISKLYEPGGRYVAAVYSEDDYGSPRMDSHWARLGDKITLRHVEEYEYYNPNTGEVYGGEEDIPEGAPLPPGR